MGVQLESPLKFGQRRLSLLVLSVQHTQKHESLLK